ncbi:hypothetical protein [Fischerella sp. PCC 9605]|uniref:hypothetical protein n=1 Tax=Fischerella sp. PCC 9605 TaxID=1173024 RepID=UPI0012DFE7B8|nr:hypothetical protein [Fischerella sp. PCC 9605]
MDDSDKKRSLLALSLRSPRLYSTALARTGGFESPTNCSWEQSAVSLMPLFVNVSNQQSTHLQHYNHQQHQQIHYTINSNSAIAYSFSSTIVSVNCLQI